MLSSGAYSKRLLDPAALDKPKVVGWSGTVGRKISKWFLKRAKSPKFSFCTILQFYYTPVLLFSSSTILQFSSHESPTPNKSHSRLFIFSKCECDFDKNLIIYFDNINTNVSLPDLIPLKFSK